jgi:hypothetical protein
MSSREPRRTDVASKRSPGDVTNVSSDTLPYITLTDLNSKVVAVKADWI